MPVLQRRTTETTKPPGVLSLSLADSGQPSITPCGRTHPQLSPATCLAASGHDGEEEQAEPFRRIATDFTACVEGVGPAGWDAVTPCEGRVARDVVRHLVEWVPWWVDQGTEHSVNVSADVDDDPAEA